MRILLVEDNADHALLIRSALQTGFAGEVTISEASTLSRALELLTQSTFDVCLIDLNLEDADVNKSVEALSNLETSTALIAVTALGDTKLATRLLSAGVQDYLNKDEISPTSLKRCVRYAIERKRKHSELAARNEDMRMFSRILAHDFRGPVRRIANFVELLQEESADQTLSEDTITSYAVLNEETERMLQLIETLTTLISVEQDESESTDIDMQTLLEEVRQAIERTVEGNFSVNWKDLPTLHGHRHLIYLVLINLIENGLKYNRSDTPQVEIVGHVNDDESVTIKIEDNGIGIEADHLHSIFEPFTRLHGDAAYTGSGLGLSIVKRILDKHSADVVLSSVPGSGTTFELRFPGTAGETRHLPKLAVAE